MVYIKKVARKKEFNKINYVYEPYGYKFYQTINNNEIKTSKLDNSEMLEFGHKYTRKQTEFK